MAISTTVHCPGEAEQAGSDINLIDTLHHRIRSRQWGLPRLLIFEFRVPIAALAHSGTPASREVRYPHLPVKASL